MEIQKVAVSVSQLAKDLFLSRSRLYQLIKAGVFPPPSYCAETGRPLYDREQQEICHEVRRTNCGVNGKPILFYSPRRPSVTPKKRKVAMPKHTELILALKSLGLSNVTNDQVHDALGECFSGGTDGVENGSVIRALFLYLKREEQTP